MISDTMPGESVPIPLRDDTIDPGMMALCHALSRLAAPLGRPVDAHRIAVLGGAAFRAYFFSPDDNHAFRETHPEVHWRNRCLSVDNYGLPEALAGHTGLNARRWSRLTGRALVELLRHEREANRAVALRLATAPERWVLAPSTTEHAGDLVAEVAPVAGSAEGAGVAGGDGRPPAGKPGHATGAKDNEATSALLVWPMRDVEFLREPVGAVIEVLTLRPTGEPASERLAEVLVDDMLRWAVGHQDIRHELVYDEEALYAAGRFAWKRMAELSTREEGRGAAGRGFLARVAAEYAASRRAAERWAQGEGPGAAEVRALVQERAGDVAELLEALATAVAEAAEPTTLPGLLDAVASADRRLAGALAALREELG